jgi:lysozyme
MNTSDKGRAFIRGHEGDVLTGYLDPVGVPTIGVGFTNRTPTVTKLIGKIIPGKTKITREQSDRIFREVLAADFEPAVNKGMPGAKQHEFDAGVSVCYNLGVGAMKWTWADLWRKGDVKGAAAYLASHYNTAKGKKLPGLVRRRKEEADLLKNGRYAGVSESAVPPDGVAREELPSAPKQADPLVKEAQEILNKLGIPVEVDGWYGPKTRAAILAYQKMHPHLVADGKLGPATLSQLRRDVAAVKDAVTKTLPSVTGVGALSWVAGLPWGWIALVAGVVIVGYFAWRYRDVIQRRWNAVRGKTVDV